MHSGLWIEILLFRVTSGLDLKKYETFQKAVLKLKVAYNVLGFMVFFKNVKKAMRPFAAEKCPWAQNTASSFSGLMAVLKGSSQWQ